MVQDLGQVICPPYDVIDPAEQEELHKRHPWNVVRLELGEEFPGDDQQENRYTRAARFLQDWRSKGVLVRDPSPALYLYHHHFQGPNGHRLTRRGLVALLYLEPLEGGVVFPHEKTFLKHKEDRLELLRACRAQFNPVFSIFPDPECQVMPLLEPPNREPEMTVEDGYGVKHLIWSLNEESFIREVMRSMEGKPIFIADGHHRYETSLAYKRQMAQESDPPAPSNWTLMYLAPMEDPGLVIFPTHKLVQGIPDFDPEAFLSDLRRHFQLQEIPFSPQGESAARAMLARRMKELRHDGWAVGMALGGRQAYWILRSKEDGCGSPMLSSVPECLRELDVTILHELILKARLGIDVGGKGQSHLIFSHDLNQALDLATSGRIQAAFLMNPVPVSALMRAAASGCKMPQKATYFYPKLLSGLLLRTMDVEDRVPSYDLPLS